MIMKVQSIIEHFYERKTKYLLSYLHSNIFIFIIYYESCASLQSLESLFNL